MSTDHASQQGQEFLRSLLLRFGVEPSSLVTTSSAPASAPAQPPLAGHDPSDAAGCNAEVEAEASDLHSSGLPSPAVAPDPLALVQAALATAFAAAPPQAPAPVPAPTQGVTDAAAAHIAAILAAVRAQPQTAQPASSLLAPAPRQLLAEHSLRPTIALRTGRATSSDLEALGAEVTVANAREKNRQAQRRFRERQKALISEQKALIDQLQEQLMDVQQQLMLRESQVQQLQDENLVMRTRLEGSLGLVARHLNSAA